MIKITALYISMSALIILYLALRVVYYRRTLRVGIGSGGHSSLGVAVRCHANAVEFSSIILILMVAAELNGAGYYLLHGAGLAFLTGRILHFTGMTKTQAGYSRGRSLGTLISILVIVVMIVTNLILIF